MGCRFTELRCKEVVNTADGCRLGYVRDVVVDEKDGKVVAIVVPGSGRFWNLVGKNADLVIPWSSICRMGGDIILVDFRPDSHKEPKPHKPY